MKIIKSNSEIFDLKYVNSLNSQQLKQLFVVFCVQIPGLISLSFKKKLLEHILKIIFKRISKGKLNPIYFQIGMVI